MLHNKKMPSLKDKHLAQAVQEAKEALKKKKVKGRKLKTKHTKRKRK